MSEPKHPRAYFFGRMAAAMTHEMKNVLAIMKESRGLMQDLMEINEDIDFPHKARFIKAMDTIGAQLDRGVTIASRFNRFAHSPDAGTREVDCGEWCALIAHLCLRHARSKELELVAEEPDAPLLIVTDPYLLLETLEAGIQVHYACTPPGSDVHIGCVPAAEGVSFTLMSKDTPPDAAVAAADAPEAAVAFDAFSELAAALSGTAAWTEDALGVRFTIAALNA